MRKYSLAWVKKTHARLTRVTRPKPFPGKYPTRIAYVATLTNGKRVSYIGKPTRSAIAKYRDWLNGYLFREVWAIEFDRNGAIARSVSTHPLTRTCDTTNLREHYHPYGADFAKFFSKQGEWRVVIGPGNHPYRVYWPDEFRYTEEAARAIGLRIPPQPVTPPVNPPPEVPMVAPTPEVAPNTLVDWAAHYQRQAEQVLREQAERERREIRFTNWAVMPPFEDDNGQ